MQLGQSSLLLLLIVVALMAVGAVWLLRWRRRARVAFAGPQARSWPAAPMWPRLVLMLAAAALIVVAAAKPRWGSVEQQREHQGVDLVIVLDVSQSMQATDLQPTRMAVAQDELVRLVESLRGNRFGLVTFAGGAFLRSPLTTDAQAISSIIKRADKEAGLVPAGSDLGSGLKEAGRALESSQSSGKAVLLVSDGEDFANAYAEQAKVLRDKGVVVFSAGAGTLTGAPLFDTDSRGQQRPKVGANGQPVTTRLNESSLNAIAAAGGGRYVRIDGSGKLTGLRDDLQRLQQTPLGSDIDKLPIERYQIFAAVALLLLVLSWLIPARVGLASMGWLRRSAPRAVSRGVVTPVVLALMVLGLGACGGSTGSEDVLRKANLEANKLYDAGNFDEALTSYQKLLSERPDVPELSYNAGNTLNRLGRYDRAVAETQRALPPTETSLGAKTYYSLGNHLLALDQLEQAYDAYKSALLLDPEDQDTKYNLEVTLQRLSQRAPKQQQGNGGQGDDPQAQGQQGPAQQGQQGQPQQPSQTGQPGQQPTQPQQGQPGQPQTGPASAQRSLAEALKGLDQNLSVEDAVRILDLLRQEQQTQQVRPNQVPGSNGVQDY